MTLKPLPKTRTSRKTRSSRILPTSAIEVSKNADGYLCVAGVDEVGRGCLAGPVVAAAVILDFESVPEGIDDSKRLSLKKRETLNNQIHETALAVSIAHCTPEEIDEINILRASLLAMKRAVESLPLRPDFLLVDGREKITTDLPQQTVIGGDGISVSIAAASIIAKVYRDRWMKQFDDQFPGYDFASNKGYGSRSHRIQLQAAGPTPIHRKTFSWTPV